MGFDLEAAGDRGHVGIDLELDDRHRRNRAQIVGIQDAHQRIGHLGEVVVEALLDPGRQHGERLDQPFDVGILALGRFELEPARDLRVLAGELTGELADESQLALVVDEQLIALHSKLSIRMPPPSKSAVESKATCSLIGSTWRIASIRNLTVKSSAALSWVSTSEALTVRRISRGSKVLIAFSIQPRSLAVLWLIQEKTRGRGCRR